MKPDKWKRNVPPPSPEGLLGKADVPVSSSQPPGDEIQVDASASKTERQAAGMTSSVTLENHKGFPLKAAKVGLLVGPLVVVWLAVSAMKANPTLNDWASGCISLVTVGTAASLTFGLLFWIIGFVLQSIFLSIKNARDPEVQKIMRKIEETDEDEPDDEGWWSEPEPPDPYADADFQSEADNP